MNKNIREVPARGGEERVLTDLSGRTGDIDAGLATDGKSIYFVWEETTADIWMMHMEKR